MRRLALAAALIGTGGATAGAALAADQEVVARNAAFSPATVAVQPGDTLTIRHDDGAVEHDLQFSDEATRRQEAGTGWTVQRTFGAGEQRDQPYTFFCSLHLGMSGRVYVNATGTVPTATPTPSATASPTTTASPTATGTATATRTPAPGAPGSSGSPAPAPPGSAPATTAVLRSASVAKRACMRCRRPGVRLRIDLSAPADVRGTLRRRAPGARRYKAFGSVRFGRVAAGPRTLKFTRTAAGRRLRLGRYTLALRAGDARRTLTFRVL